MHGQLYFAQHYFGRGYFSYRAGAAISRSPPFETAQPKRPEGRCGHRKLGGRQRSIGQHAHGERPDEGFLSARAGAVVRVQEQTQNAARGRPKEVGFLGRNTDAPGREPKPAQRATHSDKGFMARRADRGKSR